MTIARKVAMAVASLGLAGLVAACGTMTLGTGAEGTPASTTTLMTGWEQKFSLEWTVVSEPGGTQRLEGYVVSKFGQAVEPFRVLGRALDASGGVVGQRIEFVPSGVPGFGRVFFRIPRLPAAHHYIVTVWDYTVRESETIIR